MNKDIKNLISRPQESLSVEIKNWLKPEKNKDIAKIIKALLALRNNNGGYLIIGFDDSTLEQSPDPPDDIEQIYHIDIIQALVVKHSSEAFEVEVHFPERDGIKHPVIAVPGGFKNIVACKADLLDGKGKILCINDVYFRTLTSNNTPSSAKATWKDWPRILDFCFDNREADIGRFLRRHLQGFNPEILEVLVNRNETAHKDILDGFHDESVERFKTVVSERNVELPAHGYWDCSLIINGELPEYRANIDFLRLLGASNPQLTGRTIWRNSEHSPEKNRRPYVENGVWEALMVQTGTDWRSEIDFYRFDPEGKFFVRRALEDDMADLKRGLKPLSVLDFALPILRTAETIAVGLSFAKAMNCDREATTLFFRFEWGGLKGRELFSWADSARYISAGREAYTNTVVSQVEVPLDTPFSRLSDYTKQATNSLYEAFSGFELGQDTIDDLIKKTFGGRL